MNRIDKLFSDKGSDILSIFFPAGFPQLNSTVEVLETLQQNGVDMVELGIPFSDPIADGVTIQNASLKALCNGISLRKIFEQLTTMRQTVTIPVILMGYLNPIMKFGFRAFCMECKRVGVDGVIIPDLPYAEYMKDYKAVADEFGINVIMLITPETPTARVYEIDSNTKGFIYMVSSASTTGAQLKFSDENIEYFQSVANMKLNNKTLIGFGISNQETFSAATKYSAGAIIGSSFVSLLDKAATPQDAIDALITKIK